LADILHGDYYQSIPENVSFLKSINYDVLSGSEILQSVSSLDKIARDGGYEGLVIKNASSFYEYKRSKSWLKYKAMKEDDFIITGFIEGKGKYEGTLGAIQVESKDGIIKSEVGTGFSDVQRDHIWENQEFFIDNLVKVKYQEVTKDFSLRFPSFIEIRNDL
jgi:DNA ligase-1